MIQKKVCVLGAFAVGKTSLVARFVESIFSEKYLTTVGVKISRKVLQVGHQEWQLMLWDLAGEDEFLQLRPSYVRGSSGYLLVVDGTRRTTLDTAVSLQQRVAEAIGNVPFIVLCNKSDLENEWDIGHDAFEELSRRSWPWLKTSAKTGEGVEEAFRMLVAKM
jgi:small GTP-binding protein